MVRHMLRLSRLFVAVALPFTIFSATAAGADKPYHIYMMLFRGCEEACIGFQEYFRKRDIPVTFTLRDAAQDKAKLAEFVREAKRLRPHLVVAWGTTVALEAVGTWDAQDPERHITDLPVIFMIVSDPVGSKIVRSLDAGRHNVTGTRYLLPIETQLTAARAYLEFKRVGFILNPSEVNSGLTRDQLRAVSSRFGFSLVERVLPLDAAGKPEESAIPKIMGEFSLEKVDLVYQGPDSFLNTRRDLLTGAALARGIPVFSAAEAPILRSKALLGVVNKYEDVGRFTASQAMRILADGIAPAAIPIELPRSFSYLVNLPVALELGRYPPLKLLDTAELVGTAARAP